MVTSTMSPMLRDQAPAAQTTVLVAMRPHSVTTAVMVPPLLSMSQTAQCRMMRAPWRQ